MIPLNPNNYIVKSFSCLTTRGKYRGLILDVERGKIYYVPNAYVLLIDKFNRKTLQECFDIIDEDSVEEVKKFLNFMFEKELMFVTSDLSLFPTKELYFNDVSLLRDIIIEWDTNSSIDNIHKCIREAALLYCKNLQLRLVSDYDFSLLFEMMAAIKNQDYLYAELYIPYKAAISESQIVSLIDSIPALGKVYVYGAPINKHIVHSINHEGFNPVLCGEIYYSDKDLCSEVCGIIGFEDLCFDSLKSFYEHKHVNGCLYKKLAIDKSGNIKNCLSLTQVYGNIDNTTLLDVLNEPTYQNIGMIHKDVISDCCDCEMRYTCSDCRAFTIDGSLFSKPKKCLYDVKKGSWSKTTLHC
jgi:SPASM domain peptide maturase of grasp-with-spasm system